MHRTASQSLVFLDIHDFPSLSLAISDSEVPDDSAALLLPDQT